MHDFSTGAPLRRRRRRRLRRHHRRQGPRRHRRRGPGRSHRGLRPQRRRLARVGGAGVARADLLSVRAPARERSLHPRPRRRRGRPARHARVGRTCSSRTTSCSRPARPIRSPRRWRSPTSDRRALASWRRTRRCSRRAGCSILGAGPAGLELAGEIKSFHPDKQVVIADIAPDILAGPYDQALRDELRRQLDALGIELRLGRRAARAPGRRARDARPDQRAHGGRPHARRRHVVPRLRRAPAQRVRRGRLARRPARRAWPPAGRRATARGRRDARLRDRRPRATPTATWPRSPRARRSSWRTTSAA